MATMKQLISELSEILDVPRSSVNTRYRVLREAGMLVQKGRGLGAENVGPQDAATLLLSVMDPGEIKDTAAATARIRNAEFGDFGHDWPKGLDPEYSEVLPPYGFMKPQDRKTTMGGALAVALDDLVRYGGSATDTGEDVFIDVVTVRDRGCLHSFSVIVDHAIHKRYEVTFTDGDFDHELKPPRLRTTKSILPRTLDQIADVLRGHKAHTDEIVRPPYASNKAVE